MAMAKPKPDDTRVLRLSRSFQAPRERVFRAFTEAEQLVKWWGPVGYTVPEHSLDVRPGGAWRTVMRSPEGRDHIVSGVYRDVRPPERLVFTWGWETDGTRSHETVVTIGLRDRGARTELVLTHELFESESSRDQHAHGWAGCFDSLEQALADGTIR